MMVHKSLDGAALLRAVDETENVALNETEYLINFFAEGAKAYWRQWGPLGEPVVYAVEGWAQMQRGYFQGMRQVSGVGSWSGKLEESKAPPLHQSN
jgi:hypothetical protein